MVVEDHNGEDTATKPERTKDETSNKINIKTAAAIGVEIPESILSKATDLAKEDL